MEQQQEQARERQRLGESDHAVEDALVEEFENTVTEGANRLHRTWRALVITGLFGGIDVGLGLLAMLAVLDATGSKLLGGLAFGIGLYALRLAHSELFTEDFLLPVNAIVAGQIVGRYWLLHGPKGTGKATMLINAMAAVDADGAAFVECHGDPEIFRLRFGKALNYEFNEDTMYGLFSSRDPRDGGPLLDIERAMNKLEKVAIKYRKEKGRPLVVIFNNAQCVRRACSR